MGAIRLTLMVVLGATLGACSPEGPEPAGSQSRIPAVPQATDENLRQQLHALREMVVEHSKQALPSAATDERNSQRLNLLRQGFEDLRRQCLEKLDPADAEAVAVREFLESCASTMGGVKS